jgi:regulator of protease activity HflC (stomatin/prohibitin superfamily)
MVAEKQAAIIKSRAETNAAIALIEANVTAAAAIFRFEAESYPLLNAKRFLELSTEGVLGYMANRLFQDAPSLDSVILAEPAIVSRKNLLQVD